MKTNKYPFFASLLMLLVFTGCVKDDNPYPNIENVSWKRINGDNVERLFFSKGIVSHQIIKPDTLIEYNFSYKGGNQDGRHFYTWINKEIDRQYRAYSSSSQYILVCINYYDEMRVEWFETAETNVLFERE